MTERERAYRQGFMSGCHSFNADPVKVAQTVSDLYGHGAGVASNELDMAADGVMAAAPVGAAVGGIGGLRLALRGSGNKATAKAGPGPGKYTQLIKRVGMRALTKRGSVKEAQLGTLAKALIYALGGGAAGAGTAGATAAAIGSDIGAKKDMNEVIPKHRRPAKAEPKT